MLYSSNCCSCGEYLDVFMSTTRCAGRLTPCASPLVVQSTGSAPSQKSCSTSVRSAASSPAVWKPTPHCTYSRSFGSRSRALTSCSRCRRAAPPACSSALPSCLVSAAAASPVFLRELQKTSAARPVAVPRGGLDAPLRIRPAALLGQTATLMHPACNRMWIYSAPPEFARTTSGSLATSRLSK